jgi:DNA polymerase III alpha subunit
MADAIRSTHAVRLGFRQIKGFAEDDATALVAARGRGYDSVRDLWLRSGLTRTAIERLAEADAFRSLGLDRRDALWAARALGGGKLRDRLPLFDVAEHADIAREPDVALPPMPVGEHVVNDYRYLSLSLKAHPVSFVRDRLVRRGIGANEALRNIRNGRRVTVAGLAIVRQRPGTASGVIFMTIEDETDIANVVVWPKMFEKFRPVVLGARFVAVTGKVQSESGVIHVIADKLEDLTGMLAVLTAEPDAKPHPGEVIDPRARADETRRPGEDHRQRPDRQVAIRRHPRNVRFFTEGAPAANAKSTGAVMPKGRNFH